MNQKNVHLADQTIERLKMFINDFEMTIDDAINNLIDLYLANTENTTHAENTKNAIKKQNTYIYGDYEIWINDKNGIEVSKGNRPVPVKKNALIEIGEKLGMEESDINRELTTYQIGRAVIKYLKHYR